MKPMTRDTLTGITAIASMVGLVAMLVVFGELSKLGKEYYQFTLRVPSARGLTSTSPVTLNGVRIGELAGMTNAEDPGAGVDLLVEVETIHDIPNDFSVWIERGLIAGASVDLLVEPGSAAAPIADGDVYERAPSTMFSDLEAKLAGPMEQLADTSGQIQALIATYDDLGKNLNETVDEVMAEDGLRGALETRLAEAGELMGELRSAAESIRASSDEVSGQIASAGETISNAADTLANIDEAVTRVSGLAEEFRVLAASINAGEGTAGQLAKNPDLYRNLTAATERLDVLLTEAQLLIEKIKAEGVGIHF